MKITQQDIDKIRKFYLDYLNKYGPSSAQSLSWIDQFTQYTRFKILTDIAPLDGQSILDFGCGLGDLYNYLSLRFKNFDYLGVDLLEESIAAAKVKYPKAKFICEVETKNIEGEFDYIFCSGAFSYTLENAYEKYKEIITQLFAKTKKGMAFNLLDEEFKASDNIYLSWNREDVKKFVAGISKKSQVIKDYLPNDFTVYLFK